MLMHRKPCLIPIIIFRTDQKYIVTLQELYLNDNNVHIMENLKEFEYLFTTFLILRKCFLSGNKLSKLPDDIFDGNRKLEIVDISNN